MSAEPGMVWTGYNYFKIPGTANATRVDLPSGEVLPVYRINLAYEIADTWELGLLFAPLSADYTVYPKTDVHFNNQKFESNEPLQVAYKFNSYRASVIKKWGSKTQFQWRLGLTAKVRDAYIGLSNSQEASRYSNVGFVPLLYVGFRKPISEFLTVAFDLEGLAGGPGRAFDGRIQAEINIADHQKLSPGYRFVEGGVKNKRVNNFALFNYIYLGYSIEL